MEVKLGSQRCIQMVQFACLEVFMHGSFMGAFANASRASSDMPPLIERNTHGSVIRSTSIYFYQETDE